MRLTTAGIPVHFDNAIVGKVATRVTHGEDRSDKILVTTLEDRSPDDSRGFRAMITRSRAQDNNGIMSGLTLPVVHSVRETDHLRDNDIVVLQREFPASVRDCGVG